MEPDGDGSSGIALVGEALGETEAKEGGPFKGATGHFLNRILERAGIPRPSLTILNVGWCQPPDNAVPAPAAQDQCWKAHGRPVLTRVKPKVIVGLGKVASERLLGPFSDLDDMRGYPVWHHQLDAFVLPTYHPMFIQQGKFNLEPVLTFDLQRAAEIAEEGYAPRWGKYLLDISPSAAMAWGRKQLENPKGRLSFDGEWNVKTEKMMRIGFSFEKYTGMSVPWRSEYLPFIRMMLESDVEKLAWNKVADITAIAQAGIEVKGLVIDGMVMWHILNTDLPKGLGYVATMAAPDMPKWKHVSHQQPALYNACDVDAPHRIVERVEQELRAVGRWHIFERHVIELDKRLEKMSEAGMPVSRRRRVIAAKKVGSAVIRAVDVIVALIPQDIRPVLPVKGYVREPKDTSKMIRRTFKDKEGVDVERWCRLVPLKISPKLILAYQRQHGHRIQYIKVKGKGRRPTTNENALRKLALLYPSEPLYTQLVTVRKLKTLQGTFIGKAVKGKIVGGLKVGKDERAHPHWNHNPSTLRVQSDSPSLSNLPRPTDEWSRLVKGIFVAPQGHSFQARDYSGIEAVLMGYYVKSRTYYRLALIDIHTFVTAYWLYEQGVLKYRDLPQLGMSDEELTGLLGVLKKRLKPERQGVKPMVHAVNYWAKAKMVQEILFDELGWTRPMKEIRRFLSFYGELFPEIGRWQRRLVSEVEGIEEEGLYALRSGVNWVQNPFDYLHRFHQVVRWRKIEGEWDWTPGSGANELAAFPAQSTAAAIAKEAILTMEAEYPEVVDGLRLFIHDELLGEWPNSRADEAQAALKDVMERPVRQLPLPPEWEMGEHVRIWTEPKAGPIWGEMR